MDSSLSDYVVLKRLTLASDLGWFYSIFHGHNLKTKQKAITLSKEVMNPIWPSMQTRQEAYEAARKAQKVAKAMGTAGKDLEAFEKAKAKAVGTLPVEVELHGPGAAPAMSMRRIIALQDKNWRLNGDFVMDPPDDPKRFFGVLREGDLALIGFDGVEWPTKATVVLLSRAADTSIWVDLKDRVTKRTRPMIQVTQEDLDELADNHSLPADHIVRQLVGAAALPAARVAPVAVAASAAARTPAAAQRNIVSAPTVTMPLPPVAPMIVPAAAGAAVAAPLPIPATSSPTAETTPDQLARKLISASETGFVGETMVDAYLATQGTAAVPVHTWISRKFAEHPYDFELLAADGSVSAVIDAKATSGAWASEFFLSTSELACAAASRVPYHVYRLSNVSNTGGNLRISGDIRVFAQSIYHELLSNAFVGTRVTGLAIKPVESGIPWSHAITLPPPND